MDNKPKLLIVDDLPSNIRLMTAILASDYHLFVATSGQAALAIVQQHTIDLVLLDLLMPEMDGFEVCRRLQLAEHSRHIPIIIVTAQNSVAEETRALAMGAVDFISKPLSPPVVLARIQTHLGLKHSRELLAMQSRELAKQNEQLLQASQMRDDVERIMRHDLKAPLNAMIGFLDILQQSLELDQEQSEMFYLVSQGAQTLLNMINLSMELFRIEQGTFRLDAAALDLLGLLRRQESFLKRSLQLKGSRICLLLEKEEVCSGQHFWVYGEELLCESLLGNLLKNAVEATPMQQPVTISLWQEGGMGWVSIHNQGMVPAEIRHIFFNKYVTYGKSKGIGLGAYSARLLTQAQGGSIAMHSSESEGTTILFSLPLPPQ
ncbi:hybrid sensor histidine kinase/response regulator [Candidatus Magnetaquicoccus inordinatus]|uniref:hybrid sensor histidine kinase/response regulator n=1 Tax=Candidatus Magnetaquicoccus inordinatus TaxID=2496818 RepID=UPI00187D49BA|nr:hybrid sensor histidine kinase/response regulator [Candidatus Magnetaquicoccus inordinatus]